MHILVTGATGFLGRQLVELLKGHRLHIISRDADRARRLLQGGHARRAEGLHFYNWPRTGEDFDPFLVENIEGIVHLAGEGIARRRWSPPQKKQILNSRVLSTRQLVQHFNTPRLKVFICASAVGGYASHPTHIYTEHDALATPDKANFLAQVVRAWEAELQALKCRTVMLRTGVVLGKNGGAWPRLQTLSRLHLNGPIGRGPIGRGPIGRGPIGRGPIGRGPIGRGPIGRGPIGRGPIGHDPIGRGDMWMSWVHEHDWLQAVLWLLKHKNLKGPFNITSPTPVQQGQLARAVAQSLAAQKTTPTTVCGAADVVKKWWRATYHLQLPAPAWGVRLALGEMSQMLLSSQRVQPKKLQQSGFQFRYSEIEAALAALVKGA